MDRKKVLVAGYDLKFWNALQVELEKTGLFEFRQDLTIGHNNHNDAKAKELIEWADILVAEWTLGNAVYFSKHKKSNQKLICRFHLQERLTEFPKQIDYSKVDAVLFVGPHILRESVDKFKIPIEICQVIGNFIDMEKFNLPKFSDAEFNIGIIGIVPARKRLDLAFDTLKELVKINSSYRLHVKGPSPDSYEWLWARTKERKYYQDLYKKINSSELRNHIVFDPPGSDVNFWLQKIGYILSPSDFESFHVAVSEGVSSSALPIVWNWEGADEIYPPFQLMSEPKNVAKFIEISRKSLSSDTYLKQSVDLLNKEYSRKVITRRWKNILLNGLNKPQKKVKKDYKNVILIYAIANFSQFHRKEMIQALSEKLDDSTFIMIVEPGSHYNTLLTNNLETDTALKKFAKGEYIPVCKKIGRIKALYGNIPSSVELDENLRKFKSHSSAIQYYIKNNFGDSIDIIHWLYKPNHINYVKNRQKYFYEVYDEYTVDFGTGEHFPDVDCLEKKVLAGAEHVFFTSEPLSDRKKMNAKSSSVISNGVLFDVFKKHRVEHIEDKETNKRQSVGYLGNLSSFFNWELMLEVCQKIPEVDFFFHGQLELKDKESINIQREIQELSNTYFSGRVTREQGAAAINRYDVLIIPFVVNDAMHAVNPLKLWEYFATGKPVVSSPMDAIQIDQPALRVAETLEEWISHLTDALNESNQDVVREKRIEMAKMVSWDTIADMYAKKVKEILH